MLKESYLIGHVEEDEELFLFADRRELLPLLRKRVDTSGVVSTSVEDDDGALRDLVAELVEAAGGVKAASVGVVVGEVIDLVASMCEDWVVITPRRSWEEDGATAAEGVEVGGTNSKGASSGDGLGGDVAAVSDHVAGISEGQVGGGLGERGKT